MREDIKNNISELIELMNMLTEEKNYIEILKGYCENNLEKSDDLNKIYPIIEIICSMHETNYSKVNTILYG